MWEEVQVVIDEDHPSLAGHFPGQPVVPGVVILGEVLAAIRRIENGFPLLTGLPNVKFLVPLRPAVPLTIRVGPYQQEGRSFECLVDERMMSMGVVFYRMLPVMPDE